MGTTKKPDQKRPPATTPEAREAQLTALAYDLAEKRLRNGTASNALVSQLIRNGSVKEQKELTLLDQEIKLKKAKTEAIESSKRIEELYNNAMQAMSKYKGADGNSEELL